MAANLMNLKLPCQNKDKQGLRFNDCKCNICKSRSYSRGQSFEPIQKDQNCLITFIKQFPQNFQLSILPTTSYELQRSHHFHYSNLNKQQTKNYIVKTKTSKITMNYPLASNIQIFGSNFSRIIPKSEILSFLKSFQENKQNEQKKNQSQKKMTASVLLPSISDIKQPFEPNPENNLRHNSIKDVKNTSSSKVLYFQGYTQEIPIKVYYDKKTIKSKFDNILLEYLDEEIKNFSFQKDYIINEEFWGWIFKEYGEDVFVHFITEFYCQAYSYFSKNTIHKALFFWLFQKSKSEFGDNTKVSEDMGKHKQMLEAQYFISKSKKLNFKIRLANVKNAEIQIFKNILTFQQEYQQIILNKIKSSTPQSKSSLNSKKNYIYQSRLDNLHFKVRDLFLKEQNKVLNQVEKEKEYEGKEDSNKLARLLLPGMGEEQTIRQILNDQFAFQKLILFQQKKVEKQRVRKAKQRLLSQTRANSISSKHVYENSRMRLRELNPRRIRIKTQF